MCTMYSTDDPDGILTHHIPVEDTQCTSNKRFIYFEKWRNENLPILCLVWLEGTLAQCCAYPMNHILLCVGAGTVYMPEDRTFVRWFFCSRYELCDVTKKKKIIVNLFMFQTWPQPISFRFVLNARMQCMYHFIVLHYMRAEIDIGTCMTTSVKRKMIVRLSARAKQGMGRQNEEKSLHIKMPHIYFMVDTCGGETHTWRLLLERESVGDSIGTAWFTCVYILRILFCLSS